MCSNVEKTNNQNYINHLEHSISFHQIKLYKLESTHLLDLEKLEERNRDLSIRVNLLQTKLSIRPVLDLEKLEERSSDLQEENEQLKIKIDILKETLETINPDGFDL